MAAEVDQRPQYGHPDARTGLGYGQVQQTGRNAPRSAQGQFPYFEPPTDDHEGMDEEEMDNELVAAVVARILGDVQVTDPYAASGTDPFYYVAGNTKLSEDSNRMHPVGNSMAPFPRMYQGAVYANPGSPLRYYGPTDSFNSTGPIIEGTINGIKSVINPLLNHTDVMTLLALLIIIDISLIKYWLFYDLFRRLVNVMTKFPEIYRIYRNDIIYLH